VDREHESKIFPLGEVPGGVTASSVGPQRREDLLESIREISGVDVYACYQCGNCSGSCPAAGFMDLKPHAVIRLLQLGQVENLLGANTMSVCAACLSCSVRCPKGIDVAAVMEALRHVLLRGKEDIVDLQTVDRRLLAELPQIAIVNNVRKMTF
jgi:heterodisulfide reductase subunit C